MNILFLGDIVGKSGRDIVSSLLSSLKKEYDISLTIVNGENAAHGKGLTKRLYDELIAAGADYITMGNHAFSKKEIYDHIEEMDRMVLPSNHLLNEKEDSHLIFEKYGIRFCLINLLGDVLMNDISSDPYEKMEEILEKTEKEDIDIYFVDYHGETTAEKRIFCEYYQDVIDVCVGTHTHVQTADERMIGNCAFITDVGMCGPYDSVIGRDIEESIRHRIHMEKTRYTIAEGRAVLCGAVISIDDTERKAVSIRRIQIRPEGEQ
ncbi:MAG: TIGR00282 family metallophosphoesterase [Erysipelotrichaceae bacterium]|nr:TIGR00282 family metallophosphoesterase [Erysipelotrichaceae bacterium]